MARVRLTDSDRVRTVGNFFITLTLEVPKISLKSELMRGILYIDVFTKHRGFQTPWGPQGGQENFDRKEGAKNPDT